MASTWRLIRDGSRNAPLNMALDEAIMHAHSRGVSPPTIRLYGWESPSISLGYFQDVERSGIDLQYCRDKGICLVRRPTGGKAVLHGHDLTFSIVAAETELPEGHRSVLASHRWLMTGIVKGFSILGLEVRLGSPIPSSQKSADCFAHAAACDVVWGQHKLAGSAQVRRHGVILEQGSIPIRPPGTDPSAVFGLASAGHLPALGALTGAEIEDAMVAGFRSSLGVEIVEGHLSEEEFGLSAELVQTRFGSDEWTFGRPLPGRSAERRGGGGGVDIRQ